MRAEVAVQGGDHVTDLEVAGLLDGARDSSQKVRITARQSPSVGNVVELLFQVGGEAGPWLSLGFRLRLNLWLRLSFRFWLSLRFSIWFGLCLGLRFYLRLASALASGLASVFASTGAACFSSFKGFSAARWLGCPPLALAYEVLSDLAELRCSVWKLVGATCCSCSATRSSGWADAAPVRPPVVGRATGDWQPRPSPQ